MKKFKQALITYLTRNFAGSVKPAKTGNGINIFADISAHLTQIEDLCQKAELSVITKDITYQPDGTKVPAKAWIGKVVGSDVSDEDLLAQI
tara:strand:+ start:337 stop:609 length:273 start_codon:yes stop_codon:yes gene_type:complete